ncbi:TOBE domain-containing protein [Campylobacter porcelli]|uniref:Transcriptional regulator, ModE family n=1 Tax=Campylobacter porcelli TaxID=1660073 RepID=A0A1X9SVF5_9BACT|nr:TOBE domain-containing protein [Campylobacter sp. RM6137]ARR00237.1 transcriptional regulator, ModE family [Campylobacter sp. RM6137]MEE3705057.1 TOBE domain-containing protein [Campylobacter sp. CX2-8023-23]
MKARINLELILNDEVVLLPKHIKLLKALDETRSITKAATVVDISYKNAWDCLDLINSKADEPLILRVDGKRKNSGSELSQYAKDIIDKYDAILKAQNHFLNEICNDLDGDIISNLKGINMKLSARNQLQATITDIEIGAVNAQITAKLSDGVLLKSIITIDSQKELNLEVGKEIIFVFKASSVILAKTDDKELKISAANKLKGKVTQATLGAVNAKISVNIGHNQIIHAIITNESAQDMRINVGDEVELFIKASHIIIATQA